MFRCEAICAKIEKVPECLKGGKIVEIIVDSGNKDFGYKLQERIVNECERDEDEQLRLLIMMVQNEKDGVKEKLFQLIKKGLFLLLGRNFSLEVLKSPNRCQQLHFLKKVQN